MQNSEDNMSMLDPIWCKGGEIEFLNQSVIYFHYKQQP